MRIILYLAIFISLLGAKSYASNNYLSEVKLLINNSQPLLNIGNDWDVDGLVAISKESTDYKDTLKKCITNELGVVYEMFIPIFKKHLSIEELKILNRKLSSDVGKIYVAQVTGDWFKIPESPKASKELEHFSKSSEMQKLEAATFELAKKENAEEFGGRYINYCIDKAEKHIENSNTQ